MVLLRGGQSSSMAKIAYYDVAPVTIFPSHWITWQWQDFSLEKPYVLCSWTASSASSSMRDGLDLAVLQDSQIHLMYGAEGYSSQWII